MRFRAVGWQAVLLSVSRTFPRGFIFIFYFNCLVATLDPDALQVLYVNGLAQPGDFCGDGRGDCGVTYWAGKWIRRGSGAVKMHQKSRNTILVRYLRLFLKPLRISAFPPQKSQVYTRRGKGKRCKGIIRLRCHPCWLTGSIHRGSSNLIAGLVPGQK